MATDYDTVLEKERTSIARELHDGPIQTMTHIGHKLEIVQCLLAKQATESALYELHQIRGLLEACLLALRHDVSSLMTGWISPQDIANELQILINEYQEHGPTGNFIYTIDSLYKLPANVTRPLFMFVQEALQNVRKHAYATEVRLRVQLSATSLLAEVCDNGIGLQTEQQHDKHDGQHMGMRIMRSRVQEVGGIVEFESKPGKGTCARAIFPLVVA